MGKLQSIISKENLYYTAASLGAGLIAARYLTLPSKAIATVSLITAGTSAAGRSFIDDESTKTRRGIVTVCSIAASFFTAALFLNTYFADILSKEIISIVLGSNFLGQAVMAVLLKTVLFNPFSSVKTFLKLSDDQLLSLHEKYENDHESYQKLSPLMQLLLYNQVILVGKTLTILPAPPTEEEISGLTDEEVKKLYYCDGFIFTEDCPAAKELLLRFYQLGLTYDSSFDLFMIDVPLPIPSTPSEVKKLSMKQQKWLKVFFEKNPKVEKKLDVNLRWEMVNSDILSTCYWDSNNIPQANHRLIRSIYMSALKIEKWLSYSFKNQEALKLRFKELKLDHTFPLHPQTPKEVATLDETWVHHYHKHYDSSLLDQEVHKAFIARFFELDLIPPGIKSYEAWTTKQLNDYSMLEVPLPTHKIDLFALKENQRQWLFPIALKSEDWKSLSFPMQVLIRDKCFHRNTAYKIHFTIPTFQELCDTIIYNEIGQQLREQLQKDQAAWEKLPLLLQWQLNKKAFSENSLAMIPYAFDPNSLEKTPTENIRVYHSIFEENADLWEKLSYDQQVAFNIAFKSEYKDELPLKEKPVPPPRKKFLWIF